MSQCNPYDHKTVEKRLFAAYKTGKLPGRKTRTFLRKMARHIEHAWEIGRRDALSGKPMIEPQEIQLPRNDDMLRRLFIDTYSAYMTGYRNGKGAVRDGSV